MTLLKYGPGLQAYSPNVLSRTTLVAAAAAVAAIAAVAGQPVAAQAAGAAVGPHQSFIGLVNGTTGHRQPAVIRMACFGAIRPGQTGHPFAGQTVAVQRVPASARAGVTGPSTTSVGAFFGALPPAGAGSGAGFVDFTRYQTKPLPTSLTLPCAGSGTVTFLALPLLPGSRSFAVPVFYAGQP